MTRRDGFAWRSESWGSSLRSETLAVSAEHLFTTRQLRLRGSGEAEEWRLVGEALGVAPGRLVRVRQVHGRNALVLRRGSGLPARDGSPTEADVLVTDDPSLGIAVQVADCVPLLLAERSGSVVAAVHAGWRGTCEGAAQAAVATIESEFGVKACDLVAAIGPSIGPCCYAVGREVLERFAASQPAAARWFQGAAGGGLRLDLWAANVEQLAAAGVDMAAIRSPRLCTACHPELFHSYRRDGAGTGRIAAAIRAGGGKRKR